MPTVLYSVAPGRTDVGLRAWVAAAGFAVADHALGSAPAVDFAPLVAAVVDVSDGVDVAVAQTRRWRAELGDQFVPILWVAPPNAVAAGLDAGADVVLPRPLDEAVLLAQLRALARAQATAARVATRAAEARLLGDQLKGTLTHLDRTHALARRIHGRFLPRALPEVGRARFAVHHRSRPGAVSDFYTTQALDERRVGFAVGDVVGAGAAAGGLLGVFVQQCLAQQTAGAPDALLAAVNRELLALGADDPPLVALLAGVLDADTGALTLARAGLPAPVYVPASGPPEVLTIPGPFLGSAEGSYQPLSHTLRPGDRLLIGTDGTRPDGTAGRADHLLAAVGKRRAATGPAFVESVAHELLRHVRHADDFTLLGVEMV